MKKSIVVLLACAVMLVLVMIMSESNEEEENQIHEVAPLERIKQNLVASIANSPVLGEGMQAVYWDEQGTEYTATSFDEVSNTERGADGPMYSYLMGDGQTDSKDSRWANAKTEDGSYWVWIPRFAYKVSYTNNSYTVNSITRTTNGFVEILFMDGTSSTHYKDTSGEAKELPEGFVVPPAFCAMTQDDVTNLNIQGKWSEELTGIWVAKFEASKEQSDDGGNTWDAVSGTNELTLQNVTRIVSKPSVLSWRRIDQNYIYQNCLNLNQALNSHEMKNSEWGAVAFLTHSAYGRNTNEVAVNQCTDYYTGGGPGKGQSTIYNDTYEYDENNFESDYSWKTKQGVLASTTGNIYGIYDLSGGAWECVASFLKNGATCLEEEDNVFVSIPSELTIDSLRNKQIYASTVENGKAAALADYDLTIIVKADAICETSVNYTGEGSWNQDYSFFPQSNTPFFFRGGCYNNTAGAGVFAFHRYNGERNSSQGFRPALITK